MFLLRSAAVAINADELMTRQLPVPNITFNNRYRSSGIARRKSFHMVLGLRSLHHVDKYSQHDVLLHAEKWALVCLADAKLARRLCQDNLMRAND